jgi:Gram-negative bacterial TonB protein C-terminal
VMRIHWIAALAALVPALAAAGEPRLQPSSQWVVDYAENSCRLLRNFGDGRSAVKIGFESDAPGAMDLLAVGKPLESFVDEVPAHFAPVSTRRFKGILAHAVGSNDPAILWSYVTLLPDDVWERLKKEADEHPTPPNVRPPPQTVAEKAERKAWRSQFVNAATEIVIESRHDRPVILETGSLGPPIAALDQCSRDSLKDWGVDPDLEDKIVRPVWTADGTLGLTSDDYPTKMLNLGEQSDVKVRLLVDATGHVTKCTSLSHFEHVEFNKAVCAALIRRTVFQPAELADGTKVPSYYTKLVRFRMEQ